MTVTSEEAQGLRGPENWRRGWNGLGTLEEQDAGLRGLQK